MTTAENPPRASRGAWENKDRHIEPTARTPKRHIQHRRGVNAERPIFKVCYPFSLMNNFWKQSRRHCKEIQIHRGNSALLGGTTLSSGQALHLCLLCGNECRQDRTGSRTVHHTRTQHRACAAMLSLGMTFVWTFSRCVALLLSERAVSLSQGPLTQVPLLSWEGKWCTRCQR